MRPASVTERADAIAVEMIAEIGWWPSIGYMVGKVLGAGTWPRARQAARLLAAVVRHG